MVLAASDDRVRLQRIEFHSQHWIRRRFRFGHFAPGLPFPDRDRVLIRFVNRAEVVTAILQRKRKFQLRPVLLEKLFKAFTYGFGEGDTRNAAIKVPDANNMERVEADRIPYTNVWLWRERLF